MGLLGKVMDLVQDNFEPTIQRYSDAWGRYCPSKGIIPLEELSDGVAAVIDESEFLVADSYKYYFPCKMQFEDFDIHTFYLARSFSIISPVDQASNCFTGVVKFPFKGGSVALRDQRGRRSEDIGPGLNFEHRGFSEDTWVMADPEVLAYQFFHPRMIEHFVKFPELQFQAIPGYLVLIQYLPWDYLSADMLDEPNYRFPRLKAFNNIAKKFFPGVLDQIPDSLKNGD